MSDSEEEGEILPDYVKDYHLFDHNNEPVPLATLPLLWSDDEVMEDVQMRVFLGGIGDNGLHEIRKRVTAWKFKLSHAEPEIYVLSKDKSSWIQLQDPKRSYQDLNKKLLITIHSIHFLNKNPEASKKILWNYLRETFSSQESEPSKKDLLPHIALMKEAATHYEDLAKSKCLLSLVNDGLEHSGTPDEQWLFSFGGDKLEGSEIPHEEDMDDTEDSLEHTETHEQSLLSLDEDSLESSETPPEDDKDYTDYCMEEYNEEEFAESVCAICDNGGNILPCEGDCMRSFHATKTDECEGLGFASDAQVEAIVTFLCENCKFNKHQCFACGRLGSSDRSSGAEVFQCISATCGHYYHPKCVAELLYPDNEVLATDKRLEIIREEKFTCPAHKCDVCHKIEDSMVHELQFALCRRCPRAYHRKCLPRDISFESSMDAPTRAWDGLLPNRVLIYCMKHVIEPELGTPARDHLLFRDQGKKLVKLLFRKTPLSTSRTEKPAMEMPTTADTSCTTEKAADEECWIQKKRIDSARRYLKQNQSSQDVGDNGNSTGKRSQYSSKKKVSFNLGPYAKEKRKTSFVGPNNQTEEEQTSRPEVTDMGTRRHLKQDRSSNENDNGENSVVKRSQPYPANNHSPDTLKRRKTCFSGRLGPNNHNRKQTSSSETTDVKKRIRNLISEVDASFDVKEFFRKRNVTPISSNAMMVKNITLGKVQRHVEAARAALQKLEAGGTIDEAKAICDPSIVQQIVKWKNTLGAYMNPFLNGPRYSSFGRHFTKLEKLKEIADRLKWYIQSGDTIVDFCCGSNDFSCLMKEKLDEIEKPCSFKNYDLFPPQNNFCFERRDWHTVDVKELPEGSKLIMGLNPPFGVKASLANKFIAKALQFRPKLLILIVPDETRSLSTGPNPYDLIWKDSNLLHGKAFYIPGSTDNRNQNMEDWNVNPPGVYLWSRRDWSSRHKALAEEYGHKDGRFHIAAAEVGCNLKGKGVAANAPSVVTKEMPLPPEPSNQLATKECVEEEVDEGGGCGKDDAAEDSGMDTATSLSSLESLSSVEAVEPTDEAEVSLEEVVGKDIETKHSTPELDNALQGDAAAAQQPLYQAPDYDHSSWWNYEQQPTTASVPASHYFPPYGNLPSYHLDPLSYYNTPSSSFTYMPTHHPYPPLYESLPPPGPPPPPPSPQPPPPGTATYYPFGRP